MGRTWQVGPREQTYHKRLMGTMGGDQTTAAVTALGVCPVWDTLPLLSRSGVHCCLQASRDFNQ